ncbi:hypothetical protein [Roseateles depolymerans]|uniref:Uncharacterized protein n=1 Tax=Roseateles depolymerans TaxID=76731 RepID=A0A0U3MXC5_9BURK|nr:hypothetical protein [Roseateles depolymerans]ALV07683.1 hypothetical protein RD2015_3224 [Roseateles depolymerans]REG22094.1 hypothetical protein DES44_1237 [Roseateles depolymerans]
MAAPLDAEELVSYFGSTSDCLEGKSVWSNLNTLDRPEHPDSGESRYYDWVLVRRKGLELGFVDSEYAAGAESTRWGRGDMVLSQLYLYSGHSDIQPYHGAMPFGLRWSDTREQSRARLSRYEGTRHSHLTDAWDVPGYRLTVVYSDDGSALSRVVCRGLPAALEPGMPISMPKLQELLNSLGKSVATPSFALMWQHGYWSNDHVSAACEDGEIDLNSTCGLTLGTECDRTDPLLRSVTFHRQRDQDGLGWDGELPAGLDFEDSPEDLFRKLNDAPVQQADSALTGHAFWNLKDYTLHVLYSNVDNRLIRVKVSAPVTG